ncbi:hypothetical protein KCP76_25555 [Salmonella enterica subsp. enterica serovar Weltevreden]|nr:hypothetical protein KCP76_25555 [Salmonella enterica subsp. enterica serovar Weltevreden]
MQAMQNRLKDDIMQNNRLKDSPVDKHVEDEEEEKCSNGKRVTFAVSERDRINSNDLFRSKSPFMFSKTLLWMP